MRDPKIRPIPHRSVLLLFCIFNPDQAYCLTVMLLANSIVRFNLSNCAFLGPVNFHTDNECLRYSPLQHVLVQIDKTNQWTEGVYTMAVPFIHPRIMVQVLIFCNISQAFSLHTVCNQRLEKMYPLDYGIYLPYILAQPLIFPYTLGCMVAKTTNVPVVALVITIHKKSDTKVELNKAAYIHSDQNYQNHQ